MNGRSGTLSPVSVEGSEWSGISRYQSLSASDSPYPAPQPNNRGALASPPISGGPNMNGGPPPNGLSRGPNDNPSPPSSVARSSDGAGLYASSEMGSSRKGGALEETMAEHYMVLKRYLAPSLRDERGNPRPNRARDKLLRLSSVQFQELSTDVYDELQRRQGVGDQRGPPNSDPPPYLEYKNIFHPKRNQARQKLSTLPGPRFRDLATDVFYELERRVPKFAGGDIDRTGSPAPSISGTTLRSNPSRTGTPVGGQVPRIGEPRPGSRGGPGRPPPGGPGSFPRNGQPNGGPGGLNVPSSPGGSVSEYGRPLPKTFQSNTIIPNKSTLVEDDDDQTGPEDDDDDEGDAFGLEGAANRRQSKRNTDRSLAGGERDKKLVAEYQSQISELREKVESLEDRLHQKDEELNKLQDAERDRASAANLERKEWTDLRADLENKLADAQNLNESLQSELNRLRTDNANIERDLRNQLDQVSRGGGSGGSGGEWKIRFEALERDHEDLKMELREQQQVTEEVRREASGFLNEMKALTDRGDHSWEREEKLLSQVARLEDEIKEWKSRYARTKTQLRNLRASSIGLSMQNSDVSQFTKDGSFTDPNGLVNDVHVTKFQIAIDELLRTARGNEPSSVLDYMKSVVVAVRNITQGVDDARHSNGEQAAQRMKLKSRVSATANNLITAAKNFSSSNGISPVSLLDAAASHLTAAVVELLRVVKIRPTPEDELENDDDYSNEVGGFHPMRSGRLSGESVYSSMSSPRGSSLARPRSRTKDSWVGRRPPSRNGLPNGKAPAMKMGFGIRTQETNVEELKFYLEDQTEGMVQSIQSLVASIRADDGMPTIRDHIGDIATVVGKVVTSTETAMSQTGNTILRDRAKKIVRKLSECRAKLVEVSAEGENIRDPALLKDFTNRLPPLAFEIARETKELVRTVDDIDNEGRDADEDSFR